MERLVTTSTEVHGVVQGAGDAYRFSIQRDAAADPSTSSAPRLAELSYDLPTHPVPPHAKKHDFDVRGNAVRATRGTGEPEGRFLQRVITRSPGCVYEDAAREEMGSVVLVRLVKAEGEDADLHLYASTVVSLPLLACLEGQLAKAAKATFRGSPFAVDYALRVLTPTSTPPGPDEPTLVGPAD